MFLFIFCQYSKAISVSVAQPGHCGHHDLNSAWTDFRDGVLKPIIKDQIIKYFGFDTAEENSFKRDKKLVPTNQTAPLKRCTVKCTKLAFKKSCRMDCKPTFNPFKSCQHKCVKRKLGVTCVTSFNCGANKKCSMRERCPKRTFGTILHKK